MTDFTTQDQERSITMKNETEAPRVAILLDSAGYFSGFVSDIPVRAYVLDEGAPTDRVYQLTEGIGVNTGVQFVTEKMGSDPIGHMLDNTILGSGDGPRHLAAKAAITPIENGQADV